MKKFLIKTGTYGFICSLAIGILFLPKDMALWGTVTLPRSWGDYILELIRFSIITTFLVILIGFLYKLNRQSKKK